MADLDLEIEHAVSLADRILSESGGNQETIEIELEDSNASFPNSVSSARSDVVSEASDLSESKSEAISDDGAKSDLPQALPVDATRPDPAGEDADELPPKQVRPFIFIHFRSFSFFFVVFKFLFIVLIVFHCF